LIFRDYGKQVYTFIKRPSGEGLRISITWESPRETEEEKKMWERYMSGDRSDEVIKAVHDRKSRKIDAIMHAREEDLFRITKGKMDLPGEAEIYPSIRCALCGDKVMEPRARIKDGKIVCIPCQESE
jgi:formylmethanofuran dehydrogenase subunit E